MLVPQLASPGHVRWSLVPASYREQPLDMGNHRPPGGERHQRTARWMLPEVDYSHSPLTAPSAGVEAAKRYGDLYYALGGTDKGLDRSLKAMEPLAGMSDEDALWFVKQLREEDRLLLREAYRYFDEVLMP